MRVAAKAFDDALMLALVIETALGGFRSMRCREAASHERIEFRLDAPSRPWVDLYKPELNDFGGVHTEAALTNLDASRVPKCCTTPTFVARVTTNGPPYWYSYQWSDHSY